MITRPRGRPRHDDLLTPAEWRVVEGLRHGMSARLIAQRRGISLDAVKFHIANACAKLGLGGIGDLRRWDGIARHGALKGQRSKAMTEDALALGPIGQISRSVSDIGAAVAWYRDVLGLTHLFTAGPLAFFDCGGTRLFLSEGAVKPESILYFRVADIHSAHQTLVSRAVHVVSVPHIIHRHKNGMEEWMAFYADPEAAVLADAHSRIIALMAQVMPDG
jgi:DNA-binding CsgD family transcriptional regulator/catechol 2,3-dioxygenase-like lactoylglutathione lyase family enzyme